MKLIGLMAMLAFVGCAAPVEMATANYSALKCGTMAAFDIRTGANGLTRIMSASHRVIAWRDESCRLHDPIVENPSAGDFADMMSAPLTTVASHVAFVP